MGGTSTDVAHYENHYERVFETVVAGVRMQAPMLLIHDGRSRWRIVASWTGAPASAGAGPIPPASYRRGGPLAVTDCNVMPASCGRNSSARVRSEPGRTARRRCGACALRGAEVEGATGISRTPEELADGFLRIAVENMANAIKKISSSAARRDRLCASVFWWGRRPACLPDRRCAGHEHRSGASFAGVLSAYGMGLADVSRCVSAPSRPPGRGACPRLSVNWTSWRWLPRPRLPPRASAGPHRDTPLCIFVRRVGHRA